MHNEVIYLKQDKKNINLNCKVWNESIIGFMAIWHTKDKRDFIMTNQENRITLTISISPEPLAICRLDKEESVPHWAQFGSFVSSTRTSEELSIVCPQQNVPDSVKCEKGWRCFKVEGPLDFSLVGILASLTACLANAGISIFAISTYDTDYLMVKEEKFAAACSVLRQEGHSLR